MGKKKETGLVPAAMDAEVMTPIQALHDIGNAVHAALEAYKAHEIKETQLAAIIAEKKIMIAKIKEEGKIKKKHEKNIHEEKMELIKTIQRDVLGPNANNLTPEVREIVRDFLQAILALSEA